MLQYFHSVTSSKSSSPHQVAELHAWSCGTSQRECEWWESYSSMCQPPPAVGNPKLPSLHRVPGRWRSMMCWNHDTKLNKGIGLQETNLLGSFQERWQRCGKESWEKSQPKRPTEDFHKLRACTQWSAVSASKIETYVFSLSVPRR